MDTQMELVQKIKEDLVKAINDVIEIDIMDIPLEKLVRIKQSAAMLEIPAMKNKINRMIKVVWYNNTLLMDKFINMDFSDSSEVTREILLDGIVNIDDTSVFKIIDISKSLKTLREQIESIISIKVEKSYKQIRESGIEDACSLDNESVNKIVADSEELEYLRFCEKVFDHKLRELEKQQELNLFLKLSTGELTDHILTRTKEISSLRGVK